MTMDRIRILYEDAEQALRNVSIQSLTGKTCLVTGASGLVGTHFLAGLLYAQEHCGRQINVHAVARQSMPDHIRQMCASGNITFHQGDLGNHEFLQALPSADIIVHAATYGQPGLFSANPESTLKLNTSAVFTLLEKLTTGGRFLFLSTSEVYSGLSNPPFKEDQIGMTNTDHPRSCYIEAKRCGEAICHCYRQRGLHVKSVRLSLAYGPGTRPGDKRVMNVFIEKALRCKEIRLLDRGLAKRTYCYVADAMNMMWQIVLNGTQSIYNVGGESQTTVADLARRIGHIMGVPVYIPESDQSAMAGAPDDVRLDISRFTSEFNKINFTPLEQGLARTIAWQRELYSSAK